MFRSFLFTSAVLAATAGTALAQSEKDVVTGPVLRASITVNSDIVRIGDVIDNAGSAAQIAIFRAPNLGTTGSVPTSQIISALGSHQVIGVDTRNIREVSVTRSSRTVSAKDIEQRIAQVLEHRNGLGDADNLSVSFDVDVREIGRAHV